MDNRKKTVLRALPVLIVAGSLLTGAFAKITSVHPLTLHFAETSLQLYFNEAGCVETVFVFVVKS